MLLLMVFTASLSCSAQTRDKARGVRTFSAAGFKAAFPCEPKEGIETFQEEPRPARLFSYTCVDRNIKYSISLPERFENFDETKTKEQLDGIEKTLRETAGENATVTTRASVRNGYESREIILKGAKKVGKMASIAHPRGIYGVQAYAEKPVSQSEFDQRVEIFFDSFSVLSDSGE